MESEHRLESIILKKHNNKPDVITMQLEVVYNNLSSRRSKIVVLVTCILLVK